MDDELAGGEVRTPLEPLAIIGIGCRFPGDADSPEEFWQLLCEGRDAITEGPSDPVRAELLAHPDAYPHGGFLRSVDGFDWRAFRTSPREARYMDPQQRLALEVAWEAFEHAGLPREALAGRRTAVVVGIMWPDYAKLQARDHSRLDGYTVSGAGFAYAANRISAFFDLVGPSFSLDAMCASSLIAVHLACQSIWSGESELALAGGVNLILSPDTNIAMSKARILSPDGRCKTFDDSANGFVRGEGAGAIVLKRASEALADGDNVIALIRGTAVNHSGESEWIMAPSRAAQASVIEQACARAGVSPCELDYVELHGTGTAKGDPIEARALGETVGRGRRAGRPCRVGSVKTNIGHLDSAAGIAALIKAALTVHHGQIPRSLNFRNCNPAIPLAQLGLEVQVQRSDWPGQGGRRLAGVTGLSFGGANAHVVLEGPPPRETSRARLSESADGRLADLPAATEPLVLPVSAESPVALRELLDAYARMLGDGDARPLADVAYTASVRRTHRPFRVAVVGDTAAELARELERKAAQMSSDGTAEGPRRPATAERGPVLVFSGQGSSWQGMGMGLLGEPAFAAVIDACDEVTRECAGWSLRAAIEAGDARLAADGDPAFVQPALTAIELALARLWEGWGIAPSAVVGHSVGEIAAACAAGALTVEDAVRVAIARGGIMARLHGRGRTAQLGLAGERAAEAIAPWRGRVWIAGINGPRATVVAGEPEAVEEIVSSVKQAGTSAAVLPVRSAFHGGEVAELAAGLEERLAGLRTAPLQRPMISTLSGREIDSGELDGGYWSRQLAAPVRLLDAVERLIDDGHRCFLEVGPHPVLRSALIATLRGRDTKGSVVASLTREGRERRDMLAGLARLYELGHAVRWSALHRRPRRVVSLPRYAWQRERLWLDPPKPKEDASHGHPLLGQGLELAHSPGVHVWESTLDAGRLPYMLDHRVDGVAVMPASGYVELGLAAAREALGWETCELTALRFERALPVPDRRQPVKLQTLLVPDGDAFRLEVRSGGPGGWQRHATAALGAAPEPPAPTVPAVPAGSELAPEQCYASFERQGVEYGAAFRAIARAFTGEDGRLLAEIEAPPPIRAAMGDYAHHPALLDACMHVVALAGASTGAGFMPTEIGALRVHKRAASTAWSEVAIRSRDSDEIAADLTVRDHTGGTIIEARQLRLRALGRGQERDERCCELRWRQLDAPPPATPLRGRWLVLCDSGGFGEAVAAALERTGAALSTALPEQMPLPRIEPPAGVLHLCGLDVPAGISTEAAAVERAARLAHTSVLHLARRLRDTPVWLVTRGAQSVEADVTHPMAALSWGLGRTLSQEHPALWGGLIDLDPHCSPAEAAGALLRCLSLGREEDQLAQRGERVFVPRLVRRQLDSNLGPSGLDRDAGYLVTGGLGGLGSAVAGWLAERGAGHLVLVGRTELPPRAQWPGLPAEHPTGSRIAVVKRLERLGVTVHLAAADLGRPGALSAAIGGLRDRGLPPIRGAIHAAGVSRLEELEHLRDEVAREILAPKLDGSLELSAALAAEPLDFLVMFSSLSALIGSARMGPYAAGNAFQGALAAHRRARGLPAQALYWGAWQEAGMASSAAGGPLSLRGQRGLGTTEGLELLDAAMRDGSPELALLAIDWRQWARFYPRAAAAPVLRELVDVERDSANGRGGPREQSRAGDTRGAPSERSPAATLDEQICAEVADVLRIPIVARSDSLAELGFDSLMAAELRVRIEHQLGVRVPMLRLLQSPTIGVLADAVVAVARSGNGGGGSA